MPPQSRVGDNAQGICAHGCPACPHPVVGPVRTGAPTVMVNGQPAAMVSSIGMHSAVCCNGNIYNVVKGSATVRVCGNPASRIGDMVQHCGGVGQIILGSANVMTGG